MKRTKQLLAVIVSFVMMTVLICITGITAFAADPDYKISVTPSDSNEHTYEAYRIFKGDVVDNNGTLELWHLDWDEDFDSAGFLTALTASTNTSFGTTNPFASATTAADVAEVLKGITSKSDAANEFAKLAGNYIPDTPAGSADTATNGKYEISVSGGGYYLVKDQDGTQDENAYTLNLLKVAGNVSMTAKSDLPDIDKVIGEDAATGVKANTASIGDDVPYVLTSEVPDMTGYTKYYFVIEDTMSDGLTFNDDVTVSIGGEDLDESDFSVIVDGQSFKIVLKDFIQYKANAGDDIVITYTAELNDDADLTNAGNTNTVDLIYSNNPNITPDNSTDGTNYDGTTTGDSTKPRDPDQPSSNDKTNGVYNETPEKTVKTYTTSLKAIKIDGDTKEALTGAKFKLTSTDGYDSGEVEVGNDGTVTFEGIGAGTYTLTETVAPEGGYNPVAPITIEIAGDVSDLTKGCVWSTTNEDVSYDGTANLFSITVENNKGTTLPETGGIGTKIFYILGGLMTAGAVILLITKKRAADNK